MFQYDEWANARMLAALKGLDDDSRPLQLMAHVLVAQKIWLERINGRDTTGVDKSPKLTLAEAQILADENREALSEIVAGADDERLDSEIEYKNLSGAEFRTSLRDILTHVALHGAYHRGQAAAALRAAQVTPPNTDFITFVRETSG